MFDELAMVTRFVSDQDAALDFYTDLLGFEVVRDNPGPHGRFVTVAPDPHRGAELILMQPDEFGSDAEHLSTFVGNDTGLIYTVDDCQEAYDALVERGVDFQGSPDAMPWGVQATLSDPDGNEVVIQETA